MKKLISMLFALLAVSISAKQPNIVLVITDDQGYGDLGCTGNPVIKTPHTDKLANESVWLSDYHVAPTCSPSRAALISGHWTNRTGVWHTIMGRSMLRANEVTIGQMLKDNGYETGMFGKWHMGDNYPYRPEDRGFKEVYRHGGGGVGQTPDVWDNSYFDGGYFHNQKIVKAKGFCTDVFFDQANKFISKNAKAKKPFFAYICTNAPHGPLHCPQKYIDMYKGQSGRIASFFGMITNIDDNVGKTRALLEKLGVHEDTIFIFTTDNGTASGREIFNAGMRGQKGSEYDGGHRVPFFLHWPKGGMNKKHIVDALCHAVDVAPTLLDLVGADKPAKVKFDGTSLKVLLKPGSKPQWADRFLITDSQRVRDPIMWRKSAVMSEKWRLVNGTELYDIDEDPSQKSNVAKSHPDQVSKMRAFYEEWWAELEPTFAETTEIYFGHPAATVITMTSHDWIQEVGTPWNQGHIRRGSGTNSKKGNPKNMLHKGHWPIKVLNAGTYEIALLRWPPEANKPINAALPAGPNVPGASRAFRANPGNSIQASKASLRIDGKVLETKPVGAKDVKVTFETKLTKGIHELSPYFHIPAGQLGAYYVVATQK
ncbi:MAG: arylsulfatase [Verrucomicrobia bacterium]|nr:arylsulfatase [Verrucomicrobiota bacterium]MDA1045963.1 arylsulfatase [Verrucomicrobiota bacterium]